MNIPVHETSLGYFKGKIVVACKDFLERGDQLIEFKQLKNMYNEELTDLIAKEGSFGTSGGTDLNVVLSVIEKNKILKMIPNVKERFWDMFVVDALIGNNNRNDEDWGVIKRLSEKYELAPVYDNGNAFSNKESDEPLKNSAFYYIKENQNPDCILAVQRIIKIYERYFENWRCLFETGTITLSNQIIVRAKKS